jgi:hypothetical protein
MNVLLSPLNLARFQFAFVVVRHFLLPAFTSGLTGDGEGTQGRRVVDADEGGALCAAG